MADSPYICITCQRPFPDDLKQEDAPKYFAQYPIMPKTDSGDEFGNEVRILNEYITAICDVLKYGEHKDIEPHTYQGIFQLVGELSEEAKRRQLLSLEAMDEIWKRDHGTEI
jgi:hypothetical protein